MTQYAYRIGDIQTASQTHSGGPVAPGNGISLGAEVPAPQGSYRVLSGGYFWAAAEPFALRGSRRGATGVSWEVSFVNQYDEAKEYADVTVYCHYVELFPEEV